MDPRVAAWLARDPDPRTRAELEAADRAGDLAELERAFAGRLAFGTAGLRGVLGPGPARMNRLVVRETSAGLGAYLLARVPGAEKRGVVVAYDGRVLSKEFAQDTAAVLAARGIVTHLFGREAPTPLCAFAVRELGAAAGVMVTASHNPPEYNGYKVYWGNGAQIIPPHDTGIAAAIDEAALVELPWRDLADARARGLVRELGDELLERYLAGVAGLSVHTATPARARLRLAYTPLHGVGARVAEQALRRAGFDSISTVASQREPDGRFPTVRFPNPEEPGAMDAVLALARETGADLAVANDPDADRFAAAVRTPTGYRMLTGNEIGVLLGADQLEHARPGALVVTTIVSSRLLGVMAASRGVAYAETLTGFKWIANVGLEREAQGEHFIFGYEEALGYTLGGLVRDKDGISALVGFAELAAALAERGETVLHLLERIAREHGLYVSAQKSLALAPGGAGPGMGARLRAAPPARVGGRRVTRATDVLTGTWRDADGNTGATGLPASDVLVYALEGDARVIVRPSGTEPKLKCYYELREAVAAGETMAAAEARAQAALAALVAAHQAELATVRG
jgi:phosphomannomutase